MPPSIIFDDGKGLLSPLTDLRASFAVRTGALTTLERLTRALKLDDVRLHVPKHLAALTAESLGLPVNTARKGAASVLLLNGRCVIPPTAQIDKLKPDEALLEEGTSDLIAARLSPAAAHAFLEFGDLRAASTTHLPAPALLSRPWHTRTFRDTAIDLDLSLLCPKGQTPPPPAVLVIGDRPLSIHKSAKVYPGVILDTERGPIVIDEHATVRPASTICGPASIGPHSTISDRAVIKPFTALGPHCKVGGEVGGCIFQAWSNKAHDGHLGDSWVGEWVNLGAATNNSNLLNTYSEVIARATPDGQNERTGETFLGCILGDHVKTAICTRIMTGTTVGIGTMYAATAPLAGTVPPFSWITDTGTRRYRLDKFTEVARAMMARRKVTPSKAYLDRLAGFASATAP